MTNSVSAHPCCSNPHQPDGRRPSWWIDSVGFLVWNPFNWCRIHRCSLNVTSPAVLSSDHCHRRAQGWIHGECWTNNYYLKTQWTPAAFTLNECHGHLIMERSCWRDVDGLEHLDISWWVVAIASSSPPSPVSSFYDPVNSPRHSPSKVKQHRNSPTW